MLKRFFSFSFNEDTPSHNGHCNGSADHRVSPAEHRNGTAERAAAVVERPADEPPAPPAPKTAEKSLSFDQIYQNAAVKPPRLNWGILKVAEMVNSEHLSGMSPEAKRCSLLMALEAAGAEIEDLLQDAVVRQRALNDYEDTQMEALRNFENAKLEENRGIQAELDRLTAQYLGRIQANLNEVASAQDRFRGWQKQKQHESQRITEAAAFCVPQGGANGNGLTAVLERATAARR
jgi:hypothetical protein